MGSPLGPLFADTYVNYLEEKFMHRIKTEGVHHYKRFVDDTFTLVHKDTDKDTILHILNSYDNEIQFTCEEEKDQRISFLDVNIERTDKQTTPFTTSIHRKPTFTGLLLKWSSHVPKTYKTSAISSMIYRAMRICSTFQLMTDEFDTIRQLAAQNGYPKNFVEYQIRVTLNRYYDKEGKEKSKSSKNSSLGEKKTATSLRGYPYHGKLTDKLGKQLIKIATTVRPQLHVQPIPRPAPAISTFFCSKDKIPTHLQSGVVHKISCHECPATYIGKTLRQVQRRLQEHGKPSTIHASSNSPTPAPMNSSQLLRRSKRITESVNQSEHHRPSTLMIIATICEQQQKMRKKLDNQLLRNILMITNTTLTGMISRYWQKILNPIDY